MAKEKLTQDKAKNSPAGGVVVGKRNGQTMIYDDASVGGYFVGKTHKEGGIQMINKSTGQPLEVQGSEVIITAPAVADNTKREFEGKMMTNREILSAINEKGGGVAFADGGDVPKSIKHIGASYKYGGKTMTDHEIMMKINGGHLAEGYSLREIASIHQVPLSDLKNQVRLGMKAESEHTPSKREQMKIVKDHLFENPKYYSLLKKAGLNHGGTIHNESLVKDAKSGNTPARDLNNYNDVIDLQADGMVGADSGIYADGGMMKNGGLIAPNGHKTNLTPEQYKLVRTPEFKAWFGDWENDPENASKVVDENGEPMVVYHGTNSDFNVFDNSKINASGEQVFKFTTNYDMANAYGEKVFSVFLSIKNNNIGSKFYPKMGLSKFYANTTFTNARLDLIYESVKAEESQGGVIYGLTSNDLKYKGDVYFVHFSNQIKLADGSNTTFDAMNPDIRYVDGGMMKNAGLIAPNGKPSNLNAEQYKLVRTPEFKEWFGDWENDPENASKVVDENGEPLVVYHGTYVENPFYIFDFDKADLGFHFGTYEQAKNRSETKLFFKGRKSIVNSFFLNIKTIFESTDIGEWEYPQRYIDMFVSDGLISESDAKKNGFYRLVQREENKQIREYLLNKYGKFGGFVYNNKYEGKGNSFIVLNPNQIKLADGTNTKFDNMNPDIRYEDGGKVGVETILFAVRKGEPDWNEVLITNNPEKIEDAKKWALANGFDRLRVSKIDMMEKPDFKKTFADGGKVYKARYRIIDSNGRVKYTGGTEMGSWFTLDKAKELVNYSNGEMIYEYNYNGDMLWEVFANGGMFNTEPFLNYYFDEIAEFLKYQNNITLNKDFTFKYKGELFRVEPIVLSEKNIKEAYFSIIDSDDEEVGDIVFNPNNNKKFEANSDFFDWNNIKFYDGGDVKPFDANMEGDSADMMFADGGAVSPVISNWNQVPSIWKNTSKIKKVAFTNSPYDKGLYSIVAPFLGKDDSRPIMSGINFDENGITVTNAHVLITLPYPSKEFEGVYEADLSKRASSDQITIDGNYPNYSPVIPKKEVTKPFLIDVYKLLQYNDVAMKFANKTTNAVNYKIEDEVAGFNAKFFNESLKTLLKLGHDKAYAHYIAPNKALLLSPSEDYEIGNDELVLTMPVMVQNQSYGAEDMDYGSNRKLSVYYDFNDNEIHNADGSIAEFKMTYENNSIISKEDVNLLQKLANGKNKLQILDYVKVKDGVARASDLDSEYYLSGVPLPDGIYKPNKGALEITMEAIEDFPSQPLLVADEYSLEFTIDSDVLEYYVDKFQNVVGKDELRPVMQGICLHHTSDNKLFLAGTDASILLKVNITEYVNMPEVFKDMKFIIQPKRLYDFLNSTEHTNLRIRCNLVATTIESDSWSFYARNIDGNYPNYEAVIPRESTKLVSVGIEPIKKAFNSEPIKTYIKETDKKLDVIIFNKEDEIFIAKSEGRYGANPFELKDIQKLCETNVDFRLDNYYNDNKNVLLIMPYGYDKQTNFAFRKDLVDRVFKIVNSNKLDLHYTEMNRAYLIPIDTFDFKATTKEHKVREQKPSVAEIKLVSSINEVNEIKEAIETLEMLSETATRKDKKEINEAIEVLQMLLDTYEY